MYIYISIYLSIFFFFFFFFSPTGRERAGVVLSRHHRQRIPATASDAAVRNRRRTLYCRRGFSGFVRSCGCICCLFCLYFVVFYLFVWLFVCILLYSVFFVLNLRAEAFPGSFVRVFLSVIFLCFLVFYNICEQVRSCVVCMCHLLSFFVVFVLNHLRA